MFKIKGAAREREPDTYVPFIGHASEDVLLLDDGSLLAMLRLDGAAFELADTGEVNSRHAQRNILLRNIASDRVVVATHVVRTLADGAIYPDKLCTSAFARELDASYRERLMSARLFRNELSFLSFFGPPARAVSWTATFPVCSPAGSVAIGLA